LNKWAAPKNKLDLQSAYNLVCILEGDEWKMAFITARGHYEYLFMPYVRPRRLPILYELGFLIVYIVDILIYSHSLKELIQHVQKVLQGHLDHNLYVKTV
jgi:hypothetical protein